MSQETSEGFRRKLIDVTLPLTQISYASIAYKERKVGTIKNLHKWFAPMPTPALRALIFASLVDDPGPGSEREDLVELVKQLVPTNGMAPPHDVLERAKRLIAKSNPDLPTVLDPFAGGGSTIVEALRLGLPAVSADLNPVAALVTRALGELLPSVAFGDSVAGGPAQARAYNGPFDSFADDLRHYGFLVQQAVEERLGSYYPRPAVGSPVAWLWARTAPCANPMCQVSVPLFGSPWLSKQKGREATVEAVVQGDKVRFVVHQGASGPLKATKGSGRAQFSCPKCDTPLREKELREIGRRGQLGLQLMAFCADTQAGRSFFGPEEAPVSLAEVEVPDDLDEIMLGGNTKNFSHPLYGLFRQTDLYTPRQLAVLAAFADEVAKTYDRVIADGGSPTQARAITTMLGICVSKMAQSNSTLIRWRLDSRNGAAKAEPAFGSQAMPMLWDFAEVYPFGSAVGSWSGQIVSVIGVLPSLSLSGGVGRVLQMDARRAGELVEPGSALIVTDPPYFGQINYADLSDYFYLWLRRTLRSVHPDLFGTIATPKTVELVANPARHGGSKEAAQRYFIEGFTEVFTSLQKASRADLPIVVAYAAKQDDADAGAAVSSAWVSMLQAVLASGLAVVGTMPIESTMSTRQVSQGANALASYIILVCRPRQAEDIADKSTFLSRLHKELPEAVEALRKGGVSPLDMGQAAMGPGMKIFSEYKEVLQPDGSSMTVRDALIEIDKAATAVIDGEEAEYDAATRFCLRWFRQFGFDRGAYGDADVVLRQTGTAIRDLVAAGIVSNAPAGSVSLLGIDELPVGYDPLHDGRISHWEVAMHLAKVFDEGGIEGAARLVVAVRSRADMAISVDRVNRLVHRIFKIADRRFQKTATLFNQLGTAWPDIIATAQSMGNITSYTSPADEDLLSMLETDDE
jgi:putative DNA methylase